MFCFVNTLVTQCAVHVADFTLNHLNCCDSPLSEQWGAQEHLDELLMFLMHLQ